VYELQTRYVIYTQL